MNLPRHIEHDGRMGPIDAFDGRLPPDTRRRNIRRYRRVSKSQVREYSQLVKTDYGYHALGHLDCTRRELVRFNFDTPWIRERCDCGDFDHDNPNDCIFADEEYDWYSKYLSGVETGT